MSNQMWTVRLDGASQWVAPQAGGKIRWRQRQERHFQEGDSRLEYYRGVRAFRVFEMLDASMPAAPLTPRPKRPSKKVEPAPAADQGADVVAPRPESAPKTLVVPSAEEVAGWTKAKMLELADSFGLAVSVKNTKSEIQEEIDKLR